jgi:hypothetical protein
MAPSYPVTAARLDDAGVKPFSNRCLSCGARFLNGYRVYYQQFIFSTPHVVRWLSPYA